LLRAGRQGFVLRQYDNTGSGHTVSCPGSVILRWGSRSVGLTVHDLVTKSGVYRALPPSPPIHLHDAVPI